MIARLFAAGSGFIGGMFTFAVINDGANGWVPNHVGLALTFTAIAAFTAALD